MLENTGTLSLVAILGIGLVFGLKHATEVDHVIAVSTIVSHHKNVFRSAVVGALWGAGHTISLLIVAAIVLWFRVEIPERVSGWLEFGVALMIIALGISALWRTLRTSTKVHVHQHSHDGVSHTHVHFHEKETKHEPASSGSVLSSSFSLPVQDSSLKAELKTFAREQYSPAAHAPHSHSVSRIGAKPLMVGMMHGLAGSGALTLLVLTQLSSSWLGFLYVATFGVGSIFGMLLMSGLIGVPFALTSSKLAHVHRGLQTLAAIFSICFGVWYAYKTGF